MALPKSPVHVLYASATGTAEDVAESLAEKFLLSGITVNSCTTVDDYAIAHLPAETSAGHIFVLIIATCGDGQVPLNMRKFWQFIRRSDLPSSVLSNMKFAMFGLGDRAYVKFNAAARLLSLRLRDLGASMILPLALGDNSVVGGYEIELLLWTERLLQYLTSSLTIDLPKRQHLTEPRIAVEVIKQMPSDHQASLEDKWLPTQALYGSGGVLARPFAATVSLNELLTNSQHLSDDKEVRHVEFDVSGAAEQSGLHNYDPGDIIHIMPRNKVSVVDAFFKLTKLEASTVILVKDNQCKTRFGRYPLNIKTPCTLRDFASAQLDLTASPRRKFFERLAPFATNQVEKKKLCEFGSAAGAEALSQYAYREKRTILMTLRDFPSAKPPLDHLIDMIPVLKSRPFSIASSSRAHSGRLHICASIVRFKTPLRFFRVGVCSSFLLRSEVGDCVPIFLEKGTSLRFDEKKPSILVGPGTGVAPMRSFLFSAKPGGLQKWLFFGCRCKDGDFLYETDWTSLVMSNKLTELTTAFSRAENGKRSYVQDRMLLEADRIWKLVSMNDAKIYVAGSAGSMPKAIRHTLMDIACRIGNLSSQDSELFVRDLETSGSLQMECW